MIYMLSYDQMTVKQVECSNHETIVCVTEKSASRTSSCTMMNAIISSILETAKLTFLRLHVKEEHIALNCFFFFKT